MFDFAAAKQAGASDQQIMDFLRSKDDFKNFDFEGATKAGAQPAEIVDFLSKKQAASSPATNPDSSDYNPEVAHPQDPATKDNSHWWQRLSITNALKGMANPQNTIDELQGLAGPFKSGANLIKQAVTGQDFDTGDVLNAATLGIGGIRTGEMSARTAPRVASKIDNIAGSQPEAAKSLAARLEGHPTTESMDIAKGDIARDLDKSVEQLRAIHPELPNSVENTLARAPDGKVSPKEIEELRNISPETSKLVEEAKLVNELTAAGQPKAGVGVNVGLGGIMSHLTNASPILKGLIGFVDTKMNLFGRSNSVSKISQGLVDRFGGGTPNQPLNASPQIQAQQAQQMAAQQAQQQQQAALKMKMQQLVLDQQAKAKAAAQAQREAAVQAKAMDNAKKKGYVAEINKLTAQRRAEAQALQAQQREAAQQMQARRANEGILQPDEIPNPLPSDIPAFLKPTSGQKLAPVPLVRNSKGQFQKRG